MDYLPAILTVALVHFLALMSPGPDFIVIMRNSIVYSRRSGIYTAMGLGLGLFVHITYSLIGIGVVIAQSIILFSILKFFGAGYLIFIGYKAFKAPRPAEATANVERAESHLSKHKAFSTGFLTNVTNPKVTLFFLSLFTLVVRPETPFFVKLVMSGEMVGATVLWFSLVAVIASHRALKKRIGKIQYYAEKIMGVLLVALGLRLALSSSR